MSGGPAHLLVLLLRTVQRGDAVMAAACLKSRSETVSGAPSC